MKIYSLVVVGVPALTGCAGHVGAEGTPTSTPLESFAPSATPTATPTVTVTPTETSTPTAPAGASSIVLSTDGIAITAVDGSIERLTYSEPPEEAIAALTTAFGSEPVTSTHESEFSCDPSFTNIDWDGFALHLEYSYLPDGARFEAEATAAAVNLVSISGSRGEKVGDKISDTIAKSPSRLKESFRNDDGTTTTNVAVDPTDTEGADEFTDYIPGWGEQLNAIDDELATISSPVMYGASGGC